jgi:hypothetical protein
MLLTACGRGSLDVMINERGLCDGLAPKVDNLNDALLVDGGPKTIAAGDEVITGFDAGCYGSVG